jgi:hypothetical protein
MHLTSVATVAAALVGTTSALPQKLASRESSIVKGKTFDRFVSIWLENTDYDKAAGDRESCLYLEQQKIKANISIQPVSNGSQAKALP